MSECKAVFDALIFLLGMLAGAVRSYPNMDQREAAMLQAAIIECQEQDVATHGMRHREVYCREWPDAESPPDQSDSGAGYDSSTEGQIVRDP